MGGQSGVPLSNFEIVIQLENNDHIRDNIVGLRKGKKEREGKKERGLPLNILDKKLQERWLEMEEKKIAYMYSTWWL